MTAERVCSKCSNRYKTGAKGKCLRCYRIDIATEYRKTDAYKMSLLKSRMKMVQKAMAEMMEEQTP